MKSGAPTPQFENKPVRGEKIRPTPQENEEVNQRITRQRVLRADTHMYIIRIQNPLRLLTAL